MTLNSLRITCCRTLLAAGALLASLSSSAQHPGGFIENTPNELTRPLYSETEILNFLPALGLFTFPEPYNTEAIRLTNAQDCGGANCVNYVGYSYWNNINNHVGQDSMLIFLGLDRNSGGDGPTLLEYNKITDQLTNHGPLFPSASSFSWASGEGWYFSPSMPTKLYVGMGGTEILRYDVLSYVFDTVFDITTQLGGGVYLWQIHSSADDRVHSASVRDSGTYAMLGCMAYEEDSSTFHYFPKVGDFDECQIDKSGRWLLIKENVDSAQGEDNRIIDLVTGNERILLDPDGAAGHSDLGYAYMVASDNYANDANTQKLWRFDENPLDGEVIYHNQDWGIEAPAHVSHSNARDDLPPEQQYACGSSANRSDTAGANEVICLPLYDSGHILVVAPVMTDLDSGSGDDYTKSPKGNLDITGQYFIWTSNMGGSRLDAFLVKVPGQLLDGSGPPAEEDTDAPVISGINANIVTSDSATISWDTDEPADAQIEYGLSSAYGNATTLDTTLATTRYQTLSGLNPETLYHYRVKSRDAAGNLAESGDMTFTTTSVADTTPPVISGVNTSAITTDSVTINWTTDEAAENAVEYGLTTAYGSATPISTSLTTSHTVTLSGLSADTLYHYRVLNRDAADNVSVSADFSFTTAAQANPASPHPVVWADMVNVIDEAGVLRKNAGCDGCPDAGATSTAWLNGDGYLEFTAASDLGLRYIGLSNDTAGTSAGTIDFALRFQGGNAEVRENGVYRSDTSFSTGDVFRITVQNGTVTYARNGTVFYTSSQNATAPLWADTTFNSLDSSIAGAILSGTSPLLGHWPLDASALDVSGNGHNGTLAGAPAWTSGVNGDALVLDGSNDYVDIPHDPALNAYPLSVSLWVKTSATGLHGLVNKYAPASFNGYQVFVQDGMLCAWYFRDSSNYVWDGSGCTLSTVGVTDDQWHHVVFTVDDQGGTLYVDGTETAFRSWTGTPGPTTTAQNISLGRYPGTASPYLPGTLDDVRLFNQRLSAGEIADLFNAETPPQSSVQAVTWTDQVNVTVDAGLLYKNAGCDGCPDAGAASAASLNDNGYLEFTATADTGLRYIGLSNDTAGTSADTIDFALRFQGGNAEVRENGVYRSDTSFSAGDVLRIAVQNGIVTYARNGTVFYTSSQSATAALWADTTFNSLGSAIDQAILASGEF